MAPTFGAIIGKEEFEQELDDDLVRTFGNAYEQQPAKRWAREKAGPGFDDFVQDVVEEEYDGDVVFADAELARGELQDAQLAVAEEKVEELKERVRKLQADQKAAGESNKLLRAEVTLKALPM